MGKKIMRPWQGFKWIVCGMFILIWAATPFVLLSARADAPAFAVVFAILIPSGLFLIFEIFKSSSVEVTVESISRRINGAYEIIYWRDANFSYKGTSIVVVDKNQKKIELNTSLFIDKKGLKEILTRAMESKRQNLSY